MENQEALDEFKSFMGQTIVGVISDNWGRYEVLFDNGKTLSIEWEDGGLFINGK